MPDSFPMSSYLQEVPARGRGLVAQWKAGCMSPELGRVKYWELDIEYPGVGMSGPTLFRKVKGLSLGTVGYHG